MSDNIVTLAHTWDETKTDPTGWWMSEKLDGMRAVWTGKELLSRNGKTIHAPQFWLDALPKDKQLDGELYLGRGNFQKVVSVCRRMIPTDNDWVKVAFMVFDVIDDGKQAWMDRMNVACAHPIIPTQHYLCHSVDHLREFYNSIVDNGGEGVMIRHPGMKYVIGRSHELLKVKPELELVADVIGWEPGLGKYEKMVGALRCKWQDKEFSVGSGMTDADRTSKYAPAIGSRIIVKYQCLTDAGIPRFPRFSKRA
tara:strand:- start:6107 stop:6865 length:759 start_codon:yes stop_codon:yes gene_type:complete